MKSITYNEVSTDEIVEIIAKHTQKYNTDENRVIIGTDSQNFCKTKIVIVIALHTVGKGGIFFYDILNVPRIDNIRQKLITETQISLKYAEELISNFESYYEKTGYDYTKLGFTIHVDAGYNGPTRNVIPEISGWIKSCGFDCVVKPESFVASSIADRITK
jgi:predicted RNase H-related nuclease YkuK (DUF458 family)